jgi:ADP-ribose pyrophosphatase YjhB (NUDIX family)
VRRFRRGENKQTQSNAPFSGKNEGGQSKPTSFPIGQNRSVIIGDMEAPKLLERIYLHIITAIRRYFKIGAFAIIFDEQQQVLLCHRSDVWNLPGGKVEKNELPRKAVIREVKEEAKVKVQIRRLAGIYINFTRTAISFVYVCEIIKGKPEANDETDAIAYFASEQFPRYTYPHHRQWIRDIQNMPIGFLFKFQSGPSAKRLLKQGKL